jgi:hypothetical protein
MQKKLWMVVALLLVMPGLLFMVSCQKKVAAQAPPVAKAAEAPKPAPAPAPAPAPSMTAPAFMTDRVFFDFDKSALKMEAQALLKKRPSGEVHRERQAHHRGQLRLAVRPNTTWRSANAGRKPPRSSGGSGHRYQTHHHDQLWQRTADRSAHNEAAWSKTATMALWSA